MQRVGRPHKTISAPAPVSTTGVWARWLGLTPEHNIREYDLAVLPHRVVDRTSPYPADIEDECYVFDPVIHAALMVTRSGRRSRRHC